VFEDNPYVEVTYKIGNTRTNLQNNALHTYCNKVAIELNERGITFTDFFNPGFEVPWSKEIVKEQVWKPVQKAMTGEESTTKPKTNEYPKIYDQINLKLAEYGIHVPWPVRSK
jgi:tRNA U54 and U55 pseudouridine synthase Pus10